MEAEFWGLAVVAMRNFLRDSLLIVAAWKVGATVQEKFKVLP
jgi:hypothetical protein